MKKVVIFLLVASSLFAACTTQKGTRSENESFVSENNETDSSEYDICISHATECSREEEKDLYEAMESLLTERTATQFAVASPDIDLTSENVFGAKDSVEYYPMKDREASFEKIRNQLLEVYKADYVDAVLLPYYFETAELYVEQDGQLYAQEVDAVVLGLRDDWTVWKVNENYYYIQGFEDSDMEVMVILTVVRSEDGVGFLISDEVEINLN